MTNPGQSAEAPQFNYQTYEEEYARSMTALRELGRLIVENSVELGAEQQEGAETISYENFLSGLREMLKTDEEHGKNLELEDPREHDVIDGKVVDPSGDPMVEIIRGGLTQSIKRVNQERADDPNREAPFAAQMELDYGNVLVAEQVDQLEEGQVLFAVGMVPEKALKEHNEVYSDLGYREGLSMIQVYARIEGKVIAYSISVDHNDKDAWRDVYARVGVDVPEDTPDTHWIRQTIVKNMTPEEGLEFANWMKQEFYETVGKEDPTKLEAQNKKVVGEFMEQHVEVVEAYFENFYPALATAIYTGKNNDKMRNLAKSFLDVDLQNMKPETRQQIMQIANSDSFDAELGKVMDGLIRYSVVEDLRQYLDGFLANPSKEYFAQTGLVQELGQHDFNNYDHHNHNFKKGSLDFDPSMMNARLAQGLQSGVKARRSYGGCSQVKLTDELESGSSSNPLDVFGGNSTKDSWLESNADKMRGGSPREKIRCIKCRTYVDKQIVTKDPKAWRCPHCEYAVDVCTGDVKHKSKVDEAKEKNKPAPVVSIMSKIKEREAAQAEELQQAKERELGKNALAAAA